MELIRTTSFICATICAFSFAEPENEITIDGGYLKAFTHAYASFLRDPHIKGSKNNISNYLVNFSKAGDTLNIVFEPKLDSGENPYSGGEGKLGRAVEYQYDSKTNKLLRKMFFK